MKIGNWTWWGLGAATVGFTAAAFLVPWHAALAITDLSWAGPDALAGSVGHALVSDWAADVAAPGVQASSALAEPTRFWRWFHVIKSVLALAALAAAGVLAIRASRAKRAASTPALRFGWALVVVGGGVVASLNALLLVANLQGAIAPLSSVLSLLPFSDRSLALSDAVSALSASIGSGQPTVTATAIVRDFATYHAAVAVLLALVTVMAVLAMVHVARARRWGSAVALTAVLLVFAVLTFANISTAFAPTPAMQSFLSGVA